MWLILALLAVICIAAIAGAWIVGSGLYEMEDDQ